MVTALAGGVHNDECRVYYGETATNVDPLLYTGPLIRAMGDIEESLTGARAVTEDPCRGDGEGGGTVGKPTYSVSGSICIKRGANGATYRDWSARARAAVSKPTHFLFITGNPAEDGHYVYEIEAAFSKWDDSRSSDALLIAEWEITRYDGNFPTAFYETVAAAAAGTVSRVIKGGGPAGADLTLHLKPIASTVVA